MATREAPPVRLAPPGSPGPPAPTTRVTRRGRAATCLLVLLLLAALGLLLPSDTVPGLEGRTERPVLDRLVVDRSPDPKPSRPAAALLSPASLGGPWADDPDADGSALLRSCRRRGETTVQPRLELSSDLRSLAATGPDSAHQRVLALDDADAARAAFTDVLRDQEGCPIERGAGPRGTSDAIQVLGSTASAGVFSVLIEVQTGCPECSPSFRAVVVQQTGALVSTSSLGTYDTAAETAAGARELAATVTALLVLAAGG